MSNNVQVSITEEKIDLEFFYPQGPQGPQGVQGVNTWGSLSGSLSSQTDLWSYITEFDSFNTEIASATATFLPTTVYQSASGSFATNTLLQSTSALLTPLTTTNTLTGQLVLNTDFNSYKTNVASATATLLPTTVYQGASGSFVSTVTTTSPGASAVNRIIAVSALPVPQQPGVLYIIV